MTPFTVRPATVDDAATIARLGNAFNVEVGLPHAVFSEAQVRRDGFGAAGGFRVVLAEIERRAIGYALFQPCFLAAGGASVEWGVRAANPRGRAFYARVGARDDDIRVLGLLGEARP